MDTVLVWSLVSSITSVLLAVIAVALSVWFFLVSHAQANRAAASAKEMQAAITHIKELDERLFNQLWDEFTKNLDRIFYQLSGSDHDLALQQKVDLKAREETHDQEHEVRVLSAELADVREAIMFEFTPLQTFRRIMRMVSITDTLAPKYGKEVVREAFQQLIDDGQLAYNEETKKITLPGYGS